MVDVTLERYLTGGIRLLANKTASTEEPILRDIVPPQLVIALHQHGGASAIPIVKVGQDVAKGEPIAIPESPPSAGVHASSSGRVRAIETRLIPTGKRLRESLCIVLDTDGEDRPFDP